MNSDRCSLLLDCFLPETNLRELISIDLGRYASLSSLDCVLLDQCNSYDDIAGQSFGQHFRAADTDLLLTVDCLYYSDRGAEFRRCPLPFQHMDCCMMSAACKPSDVVYLCGMADGDQRLYTFNLKTKELQLVEFSVVGRVVYQRGDTIVLLKENRSVEIIRIESSGPVRFEAEPMGRKVKIGEKEFELYPAQDAGYSIGLYNEFYSICFQ